MKIEGIDEIRKPRADLLQRWLPPESVETQPEQPSSPQSDAFASRAYPPMTIGLKSCLNKSSPC